MERFSLKQYPGDWIGEQADFLLDHIQKTISRTKEENSPLTQDQILNIIGHSLVASEYMETMGKDGETLRGAFELTDSLGIIVGPFVPEFQQDLSILSNLYRNTVCGAQFRVRRALEIPSTNYRDKPEPENRELYLKLAEHAYQRDSRLKKLTSIPDQKLPKDFA